MKTVSRVDLKKESDEFLKLHWNQEKINIELKENQWDWMPWKLSGEIPNGKEQGCYALLSNENVIYIGVGASRGSGIYAGCGLGARVTKYFRLIKGQDCPIGKRVYEPAEKLKGENITEVLTIGFPKHYGYLSLALESFLLNRLETALNVARPGGVSKT